MKIEKLIPDINTFSDKDHFSKNTSTQIKKNEFELCDNEKCVNDIFSSTFKIEFVTRFKKEDKKLEFLENIKPYTYFNE